LVAPETAPSATFASVKDLRPGVIGVPAPGVSIKLVPNGRQVWKRESKSCHGDAGLFGDNQELSAKAFG